MSRLLLSLALQQCFEATVVKMVLRQTIKGEFKSDEKANITDVGSFYCLWMRIRGANAESCVGAFR